MVQALLCAIVVYSLLIGQIPHDAVIGSVIVVSGIQLFCHHHHDSQEMKIDKLARASRYYQVAVELKLIACIILLLLCTMAQSFLPPLVLGAIMAILTLRGGSVSFRQYISLLTLPTLFLVLSGVALLWSYHHHAIGVLQIPFGNGYLVLTQSSQQMAQLVMARALGGICVLYFLSLSTPMPEILSALRRMRCPDVMIGLAILIYRYIFILLATYHDMKAAATSRLGYTSLCRSIRTTGKVYANLLARSFRRADQCFAAMESRGFNGTITFLQAEKPMRLKHFIGFFILIMGMGLAVLMVRGSYA